MEDNQKQIYIVLSQTGTVLSRILHLVTKKEYNHSSISMNRELTRMYSFGRRNPYNPISAGFVRESPHFGTFKRFPETKIAVLSLAVSEETYKEIGDLLEEMIGCSKHFHYDFLGLCAAAFRVNYRRRNHFYCSAFVKDVLEKYDVEGVEALAPITHPVDFMTLHGVDLVYRGKMRDLA